jgi:hypothetical protein
VADLPGELAERFESLGVIGEGSFGRVWRARQRDDGVEVAIKLLSPEADPERFAREAVAGERLDHPNLVRTLEAGAVGDAPYLVLPFYPGGTLEERLRASGPLAPHEAERLLTELFAGLEAAHDAGVVHRDLKPANVLFDAEGRAVIADLGLARVLGERTLTKTGWMVGTPRTMPPEQFLGEEPKPSWDIYAALVIYSEALTGIRPFPGGAPGEILAAKQAGSVQGMDQVSRRAGPARADLVEEWLGPDAAARPESVAAAREALVAASRRKAGPDVVSTVVPGSPVDAAASTSGGRRGTWLVAAALVAMGVGWWGARAPGTPRPAARLEMSSAGREGVQALVEELARAPALEELLSSSKPRRTPDFEELRVRARAEVSRILRERLTKGLVDELTSARLDLDLVQDLGKVLLRLRLLYRERDRNELKVGGGERLARLEEVYARVVRTVRIPQLCDYPVGKGIDWEARQREEEEILEALGGRWACRRNRADWPEYDLPTRTMRTGRLLKVNLAGRGHVPQAEKGATAMISDLFRNEGAEDHRRKDELDQPEARIGPLRHAGGDLVLAGRTLGWDQTIQGVVEVVGEDGLEVVFAVPYEYFPPPETEGPLHTARTGWMLWVSAEVLPPGVRTLRLRPVALQALGPPQSTVTLEFVWHHEGGDPPRVPGLVGPG